MESLAPLHGLPLVALRESREIASLLTLGLFRPVILLPRGRRRWSAEQRALILGHELAHVRRRDFLAGLVAELAVCLCWFHPLVRWLASRLRLEQEYAADAWAVSAAADATDYVRCLARLALELDRGHGFLAPAFWRRRPEILRRIDMLRRNPKGFPTHLRARAGWTVAALAVLACLAVGGVGPLHSAANRQNETESVPEANGKATVDRHGDLLPSGALARFGTTRMRHGAEVTFVAFGPGGKTLLTAGRDNTIRLWELATGKEIRRFAPPKSVPVKPSAGKDKKKLDQNEVVMQLMAGGGTEGRNARIAVTADGKTLAISRGNVIQLYKVETGEALRQIQGLANGYNGLLLSPDGKALAIRGRNQQLSLWETQTGKELHPLSNAQANQPAGGGFVLLTAGFSAPETRALAISADGKYVASAEGSTVRVWETVTGKELPLSDGHRKVPTMITLSQDGKTVVSWGGDRVVRRWEAATGKLLGAFPAPPRTTQAALSRDGRIVALANADDTIRLHDTATGKLLHKLQGHAKGTAALAFTPDGKVLASHGSADNSIRSFVAEDEQATAPSTHEHVDLSIAVDVREGGVQPAVLRAVQDHLQRLELDRPLPTRSGGRWS
jgi:WD40 repeat protein